MRTLDRLPAQMRRQVEQGISLLKHGGVVAYPTDTVYGLGACAGLVSAVERIYEVKQRPRSMALPLLLADISQLSEVATEMSEVAWCLARHFWPGALTLVLRRSRSVPDVVTAGTDKVAVRVPAHPVPVALIEGIGAPIIGTSANLSGHPSPLTAEDVRAQLDDQIDLIIDGGKCPGGKESTIVDVTGEVVSVLRVEAIGLEELERVCGKTFVSNQ